VGKHKLWNAAQGTPKSLVTTGNIWTESVKWIRTDPSSSVSFVDINIVDQIQNTEFCHNFGY